MPAVVAIAAAFVVTPNAVAMKDYGTGEQCLPAVEQYLREGNVDLATVESIKIDAQFRQNNDGDKRFQGYQAWVRTRDVDGAIVLLMRFGCELKSTWTTGNQTFSGPGIR